VVVMKILDLGCGDVKYRSKNPNDVIIGLDSVNISGVDVVHNIEHTLPFKDDDFDIVRMNMVLEHVDNILGVMDEVWRITKKKGNVIITVPYHSSRSSVADPTHKRSFCLMTIEYFLREGRIVSGKYIVKNKFELISSEITFKRILWPFQLLINSSNFFRNFYDMVFPYIIPASSITWKLRPIK